MNITSLRELPVTCLNGVGPQLAGTLQKLDIVSLQDLLFHLPLRYLDRTRLTSVASLKPQQMAVVQGRITSSLVVMGKRRSLLCTLEDASGVISLRFFYFSASQKNRLAVGTPLRAYGEVRLGATGLELYHPEYDILEGTAPRYLEKQLTPVYALTEGLGQGRMRKSLHRLCPICSNIIRKSCYPRHATVVSG